MYFFNLLTGYLKKKSFWLGCSLALGIGIFGSFFILPNSLHNKGKLPIIEPYENKYYDSFDLLESRTLNEQDKKALRLSILVEHTPKGNVLMYYDMDKESFIYYCDSKDISYIYLETVLRKYALTFDCKSIVVDIKHELQQAKKEKPSKKVELVEKNNVYVEFKEYNKSGLKKEGNTSKSLLREKANRYSYKGKIKDFDFVQKYHKKEETISYETFKNLMNKKN
tara:strand:- start:15 stop:686 length:672 start_codon:yes stop_codon:yes gene_type:complete